MTQCQQGSGGVRSAHTQGCCLVRPTSRTEELLLFLPLSVELSFQVSHGRGWGKPNSRGNATKLWSSQRSHSPSSQRLPGSSSSGSESSQHNKHSHSSLQPGGLRAGREKANQAHSAQLSARHPRGSGCSRDNAGFNHHGAPAPLSLHPRSLL